MKQNSLHHTKKKKKKKKKSSHSWPKHSYLLTCTDNSMQNLKVQNLKNFKLLLIFFKV